MAVAPAPNIDITKFDNKKYFLTDLNLLSPTKLLILFLKVNKYIAITQKYKINIGTNNLLIAISLVKNTFKYPTSLNHWKLIIKLVNKYIFILIILKKRISFTGSLFLNKFIK